MEDIKVVGKIICEDCNKEMELDFEDVYTQKVVCFICSDCKKIKYIEL